MNWDKAEEHLYITKEAYEELGVVGTFGLALTINPIVRRYESGERSQDLYDEIMRLN